MAWYELFFLFQTVEGGEERNRSAYDTYCMYVLLVLGRIKKTGSLFEQEQSTFTLIDIF